MTGGEKTSPPTGLIDGVVVKPLKVIPDQRGRLMVIMTCDDKEFQGFGQVYMTTGYPGAIKAWHYHKLQTDYWAVVQGMAMVGLCDRRPDSPTKGHVNQFYVGVHNPCLVQIPPGVLHGFKCISEEEVIIVNTPTHAYNYENPDEYRVSIDDPSIQFDWTRPDA